MEVASFNSDPPHENITNITKTEVGVHIRGERTSVGSIKIIPRRCIKGYGRGAL